MPELPHGEDSDGLSAAGSLLRVRGADALCFRSFSMIALREGSRDAIAAGFAGLRLRIADCNRPGMRALLALGFVAVLGCSEDATATQGVGDAAPSSSPDASDASMPVADASHPPQPDAGLPVVHDCTIAPCRGHVGENQSAHERVTTRRWPWSVDPFANGTVWVMMKPWRHRECTRPPTGSIAPTIAARVGRSSRRGKTQ